MRGNKENTWSGLRGPVLSEALNLLTFIFLLWTIEQYMLFGIVWYIDWTLYFQYNLLLAFCWLKCFIAGKVCFFYVLQKKEHPVVFLSYCWSNSHSAVKQGTREVPGALGALDPRQLKKRLEQNGFSCWLDIMETGKVFPSVLVYCMGAHFLSFG